jgi:hypothetical protein
MHPLISGDLIRGEGAAIVCQDGATGMTDNQPEHQNSEESERRKFLGRAGKIALTVPPSIALLLAAEGRHYAFAQSGAGRGEGRAGVPDISDIRVHYRDGSVSDIEIRNDSNDNGNNGNHGNGNNGNG